MTWFGLAWLVFFLVDWLVWMEMVGCRFGLVRLVGWVSTQVRRAAIDVAQRRVPTVGGFDPLIFLSPDFFSSCAKFASSPLKLRKIASEFSSNSLKHS